LREQVYFSGARHFGLHTISGDVQLNQLCEVGNFGRQFLNLVVTEAQLSQIVQFEERLNGKESTN